MSNTPGEEPAEQAVFVRGQRFLREDVSSISNAQIRAEVRLALMRQFGEGPEESGRRRRRPPPYKLHGKGPDAVPMVDIKTMQKRCLGLSVTGATSNLTRVTSELDMRLIAQAKARREAASRPVTAAGGEFGHGGEFKGAGEGEHQGEGYESNEETRLARPQTAPTSSLWTVQTPEMRLAILEKTKERRDEIARTVKRNRDNIRMEYAEKLYFTPTHHMAKIRYLQEEGKHLKEIAKNEILKKNKSWDQDT